MIRRNTWIAVGIFAIVVVLALLLNQTNESPTALEPISTPTPLWSVSPEEIVAIIVEERVTGTVLEVERNVEDLWRMTRPDQAPADAARIERAASWLSAPTPQAQLFDVEDLSEFRLDSPDYRIQLLLSNGRQLRLSVGREAPTGGSRYVISPEMEGVLIMSTLGLDEVLSLLLIVDTPAAPFSTPAAEE